jgi:hypothetical protein
MTTPIQTPSISPTQVETARTLVTSTKEPTDPPPYSVTYTPSPSPTRQPTQPATSQAAVAQTAGATPQATAVWSNTAEALGEVELPRDWVADADLTGSVTVTHPADWTVSEQGMYEISLLGPRHAWAKVRFVDRASSIGGKADRLAALSDEMRDLESSRSNVLQVEQTLLREPLQVALISVYAQDPQRTYLICHVVHAWLPLDGDYHVYGTLGRYAHIAPSLTAGEVDALLLTMVATARDSLPASP